MKNDLSRIPLAIQARLLEPKDLIDDIKVADQELIVIEMRISFLKDDPKAYVFELQNEK